MTSGAERIERASGIVRGTIASLLGWTARGVARWLPGGVKTALKRACLSVLPPKTLARLLASRSVNAPDAALLEVFSAAIRRLPSSEAVRLLPLMERTERLDYGSADVYLTVTSPAEHLRSLACRKEPWTVAWIEQYVKPSDVFYDVGANVGAYSLLAAKRTGGRARVFAFEPAFPNFPQLCRNIILNGCDDAIVPLPIALAERTSLEHFNYADLERGSALHTLGLQIDYRTQPFIPVYRQPMLAFAMDDLVDMFRLPVPNHIKIDVDGTELDVLRGARTTLARRAVQSLLIEICDLRAPASEISNLLRPWGWCLAERHDRRDAEGESLNVSYLLFVRGGA